MNPHVDVCLGAYTLCTFFGLYGCAHICVCICTLIPSPPNTFLPVCHPPAAFIAFFFHLPSSPCFVPWHVSPAMRGSMYRTKKANQHYYPSRMLPQGDSDLCVRFRLVPYQRPVNTCYTRLSPIYTRRGSVLWRPALFVEIPLSLPYWKKNTI